MKKTPEVGSAERESSIREITYELTEGQWLMRYEPPRHHGQEASGSSYAKGDAELTSRTWRTWADLDRIEARARFERRVRVSIVIVLGLITIGLIILLWNRT